MESFFLWYSLGLCVGFVPGDDELTMRTCQDQYEAQHRYFEGEGGFGLFAGVGKGLGVLYISDYVEHVVRENPEVSTVQANMCLDHHPFSGERRYRRRPLVTRQFWGVGNSG